MNDIFTVTFKKQPIEWSNFSFYRERKNSVAHCLKLREKKRGRITLEHLQRAKMLIFKLAQTEVCSFSGQRRIYMAKRNIEALNMSF